MSVGLSPAGARGQFLGFDAEGYAYVLEWWPPFEGEPGYWGGSGMQHRHPSLPYQPFVFLARGDMQDFIVRHVPVRSLGREPLVENGHLWRNLRDAYGWPEAEIQDRWLRGDEFVKPTSARAV